jgi:type VII secretion protein EccB
MASRRDQFQSYQFSVRRVISSLVLHETDPAQPPLRRMSGATFGGVMIAVLVLAVAGVIGVVKPSSTSTWQDGGKVIVVKETGARYVWLADQKTGKHYLYPVTNFASGALLANSTATIYVQAKDILNAPRGPLLGLPDAPDVLPPTDQLLGAPWTLCSLPAQTISGETTPNTALVVGRARTSGTPVGQSAFLLDNTESRDKAHEYSLVWHGHSYPIPDPAPVLEGLTLHGQPQIQVGAAWMSALPAGKPLAVANVAGRGQHSTLVRGGVVGEVMVVQSAGGSQYYLLGQKHIQAITPVQADITLADPTVQKTVYGGRRPKAVPLSAAEANSVPQQGLPAPDPTNPPATKPAMASVNSDQSTVCASFNNAGLVPDVAVQAAVEGAALAPATQQRTQNGTVLANRVVVEPGWGSIVESMSSPTATSGSLFVVTDEGRRYGIASDDALQALGYSGVAPIQMPASLVARIPAGDALDPLAAQQQAVS